ncbi:hypothetical protein ANN_08250 [Periplaneta americana]|uniref:Uncharacterized protein n=1 Tax=Periplaneta americana TaxID=6978 RepID=A0ABQ8T0W0_PERAM|nr:hypothetical protein ANN_08250 [Periplaneta americana]
MDLREEEYDDRDWINLAQDRDRWRAYLRAAMNLREPHTGSRAPEAYQLREMRQVRSRALEEIYEFLNGASRRDNCIIMEGDPSPYYCLISLCSVRDSYLMVKTMAVTATMIMTVCNAIQARDAM